MTTFPHYDPARDIRTGIMVYTQIERLLNSSVEAAVKNYIESNGELYSGYAKSI